VSAEKRISWSERYPNPEKYCLAYRVDDDLSGVVKYNSLPLIEKFT